LAKAIGVFRRRLERYLKRVLGTMTSPPQIVGMETLADVAAATKRLVEEERSPESKRP
jgi:hypothetical protein